MKRLMKAATVVVTRERYQTAPPPADASEIRPEVPSESAAIDILRLRIAELERQLEDTAQTGERKEIDAYERGVEEGRQKAEEAIQRDHGQQINLLKKAIEHAVTRFDATMDALTPLSLDIAEAALSRVIDDPSHYADLMVQIIERQLRQFASDAMLSIEVSASDFPADSELESRLTDIRSRHGLNVNSKITADAGTCIIHLSLGRIDASLQTQRQRLAAMFTELRSDD